jgi:hypothetical protein
MKHALCSFRLADDLVTARVMARLDDGGTGDALTSHIPILSQVLKSAALGLGNKKSGEDTAEHEGREDLHNMVKPWASGATFDGTASSQRRDGGLGDNGPDLTGGGRDTVGGRPVASREALSGHDEGGGVGAPVEEKLNEDVDAQHAVGAEVLEGESPDDEQDGQEDEANELQGLAADSVKGSDREPVTRDGTSADENAVTGSKVKELMVDGKTVSVTDGLEDSGGIQAKTVKRDVK